MEPGAPDTKRPRLNVPLPGSWSNNAGVAAVSLPPPQHPPVTGGPHHAPPPYHAPPPSYSRPSEPPQALPHHPPHDDRRHLHHQQHDHEPYPPPLQDPARQHPPSPAHSSYPPYPSRDPVVKRDVDDHSLNQMRRPSSTGHPVDSLPAMPPHPNQQHPEDPRRHMSFDNGPPSMPHSPALYRPPPQGYHPPPPTPVGQPPHYEGPHVYGVPTPLYPAALEIQAASAKRKAQRASQACDNCRQLKAKCDETKPCKNCREKNVDCKYRDPPTKQPDKVHPEIMEALTSFKEELMSMRAMFDQRFNKIENRLSHSGVLPKGIDLEGTKMKRESIEDDPQGPHRSPISNREDIMEDAADTSSQGRTAMIEPDMTYTDAQEALRNMDEDDVEPQPGPAVPPGKPMMPQNHTTLASLLLKWGPIHQMLQRAHILETVRIYHVEEYPIRQEQQRGVLKIVGRGEGPSQDSKASDKGTPQDWLFDVDEASDLTSSTPAHESWGQTGDFLPTSGVQHIGGVLNSDGNPDWDPKQVWKYVQSFKQNILSMHPIIIPAELDAMVKVFLDQLPKSSSATVNKTSGVGARFIAPSNGPAQIQETGTKRKRSPATEEQSPVASFRKPGVPFRNIESCLVLLVFALGKICLHRGKIPDVIRDVDDINSPMARTTLLHSPSQGSPPGSFPPSQSSGLPSPKDSNQATMMSRRSSLQGPMPITRSSGLHRRNLEAIPGLEYFALASDILGGHFGNNNLKRVWVHILAGLYHGQLGRVLESWDHIALASRSLQVVLRPSLGRLSRADSCNVDARRDNQLAFAFWTCLQLESDILAELPLPQSGILQYEEQMPYPNVQFAINHQFIPHEVEGYLAQLYLRKQLNKVHNLFYDPEKEAQNLHVETMEDGVNEIQGFLKTSRHQWAPPHYQWQDSDPLPTDILRARLRAKYWGSQVILYRPFLRTILEGGAQPSGMFRSEPPPSNLMASLHIDENDPRVRIYDPRIFEYARHGIDALVESTRAFHGIDLEKRLIITNVFGTAHAQWGNLLTLSACYKDNILKTFIDSKILSYLFSRTIAFFRTVALPSSALMTDLNMLIALARELGFTVDEPEPRTDSSFSSIASNVHPPMQPPNQNYTYHGASSPSMTRNY
ncbi:hypothetical protein F5Y16DRAFT_127132 [Xylariaceae sp. FL0255]|nr:hypothetical protein F5Y16DRAFT_127132 [Xylariaceae sp. FL0255]